MIRQYATRKIINFIWQQLKANRLQVLNNILAGLLIVALELLFVWLTKQTVDIATHQSTLFSFSTAIVLLVCVLVFQLLLTAYRSWINTMLHIKATNRMQRDIFRHTLCTEWSTGNELHSADIVNRMEKDVSVVVNLVTEILPAGIVVVAQFAGAFTLLYLMDKSLAMFVVVVIPFFIAIGKLYVGKMRALSRQIRQTDSQMQLQYQEGIANREVIKSTNGAINVIFRRLSDTQTRLVKLTKHRALWSIVSNKIVNLGFVTAYMLAFAWGAYQLSVGQIGYGALIAFIQLVGQIQRPARSIIKFVPNIINTLTSTERLLQIKTMPLEHNTIDMETTNTGIVEPLGIRLNDVWFHYQEGKNVLSRFSHDFTPGSRTAIVGPTGYGKTTLARLILALLSPNKGDIALYNNNFCQTADNSTRQYFAYVPQGNTLFSGTIRNNLLLALPNAADHHLRQALLMADAEFVYSLPNGLDTDCGEHGLALSVGQAQRLCIARALLLRAPILILDEATSALDSKTEERVLCNIFTDLKHTTIICITHRQKVIDYCENIVNIRDFIK